MAGKKKETTKKEVQLKRDPLVDEMKSQLIDSAKSIASLTELIDKMHSKQIELEKLVDRLKVRMGL
tara:strand:+ start:318 stop:515 length:198 start_codon:yes stop_codon:yes gene_type:complete